MISFLKGHVVLWSIWAIWLLCPWYLLLLGSRIWTTPRKESLRLRSMGSGTSTSQKPWQADRPDGACTITLKQLVWMNHGRQLGDRREIAVMNTLSSRSSWTLLNSALNIWVDLVLHIKHNLLLGQTLKSPWVSFRKCAEKGNCCRIQISNANEQAGREVRHHQKLGGNAHHSKLKSASFSPLSCLSLVATRHQIMHAYETLVVMPSRFVCCLTRGFFEGNEDGDKAATTQTALRRQPNGRDNQRLINYDNLALKSGTDCIKF